MRRQTLWQDSLASSCVSGERTVRCRLLLLVASGDSAYAGGPPSDIRSCSTWRKVAASAKDIESGTLNDYHDRANKNGSDRSGVSLRSPLSSRCLKAEEADGDVDSFHARSGQDSGLNRP